MTYLCVGTELRTNEHFLSHGTKAKISFDAMKLSPFCKLYVIAKSIESLIIQVTY